MIEIEFEPAEIHICECCGKDTVRLTRFVHKDGNAHAVYYAQYSTGHEIGRVSGIIGLGEWGEASEPSDRLAFPFELWETDDNFNVGHRRCSGFAVARYNLPWSRP